MFHFVLCSYPSFVFFFTGFLWLPPIFTDHLLFFQSMCDSLSLAFSMFNFNWHIILPSYFHMKSIWSKVFFTISPGCLFLINESSNWNKSVRIKKKIMFEIFERDKFFLDNVIRWLQFWTNKVFVSKQKIRHFRQNKKFVTKFASTKD